jgi:hypothetical protein
VGGTFFSTSDAIVVSGGGRVQLAELAVTYGPLNLQVSDSTSSLEIGTAGGVAAGSLTVDNGMTVTAAGYLTAPNIVINGTLAVAAGGEFTLNGPLGGNGQIQIGAGANLANLVIENNTGQPAGPTVPTITFGGGEAALTIYSNALTAANAFSPIIVGLNSSDVIDYEGTVTSAAPGSFNGTDTNLTLYDNTTVVATLTLQGDYSGDTFYATAIYGSETEIAELSPGDTATAPSGTSGADNYVWATVAGSWDNAANWDDTPAGTSVQSNASVAPGSNDNVTIDPIPLAGAVGVNVITGVGDSASLTINGSTALAGQFTTGTLEVGGGTLAVNAGDALTVTGNAVFATNTIPFALDGTFTVDGNLSLTASGVHYPININGGTLTLGSLTTDDDTFSLSSGSTLSVAGNVTDSYGLSSYNINDSTFTVGGTFNSVNDSIYVGGGGRVQLANLAVTMGTSTPVYLNVEDNTSSLEIGTAGGVAAGSLTVDNGMTVTAAGNFTAPNIIVAGALGVAAGGTFTLNGSLGGNGQIQIGTGANLIIENFLGQPAAATAPTITFEGSQDILTIDSNALNGTAFVPVLVGLNGSDVIDYEGTITSATPGSFNGTDTVVTLYDNTTFVATLTLQGDHASDTFVTTAIGGGVTQIVDQSHYVWATVAGSWDSAANWNDTSLAQSPAAVAPGSNDNVTINAVGSSGVNVITGVGDSASLTINGSTSLAGQFTTGTLAVNGSILSVNLNTGDTLTVTGNTSVGGQNDTVTVDGTLTVQGEASLSFDDLITATGGGRIQLGGLTTSGGNVLSVDSTSSIEIGTTGGVSAGSITIDQLATATAGGNATEFSAPNVVVDGTLAVAAGSVLLMDGSLGGSGQIQIGSGGKLIVENSLGQPAATNAPTINFEGANDVLTIDGSALNGTAFVPVLVGLNASDVIDYEGTVTSATPGSFNGTDTVVTLYDNTTVVATLTLQGDYSSNSFITTQIGSGVTQIVDPPAVASNTTPSEIANNTALQSNMVTDPSSPSIGNETVNSGGLLELKPGTTENVQFAADTGTLKLNDSQHFAGLISRFSGRDVLDLADIAFSPNMSLGYAANTNNSGGNLTVNDGTHVASLALLGNYMASSFVASSDGHGGTFIEPSQIAYCQQSILTHPHV